VWLVSVTVPCQEVLSCANVVVLSLLENTVLSEIVCKWDRTGRHST
jgi:hypothetical protein